jgi:hypothetical protein
MMTLKAELHQDFDDFGADLKKRIWKIHLSVQGCSKKVRWIRSGY